MPNEKKHDSGPSGAARAGGPLLFSTNGLSGPNPVFQAFVVQNLNVGQGPFDLLDFRALPVLIPASVQELGGLPQFAFQFMQNPPLSFIQNVSLPSTLDPASLIEVGALIDGTSTGSLGSVNFERFPTPTPEPSTFIPVACAALAVLTTKQKVLRPRG